VVVRDILDGKQERLSFRIVLCDHLTVVLCRLQSCSRQRIDRLMFDAIPMHVRSRMS
jgi:hypothetical protein